MEKVRSKLNVLRLHCRIYNLLDYSVQQYFSSLRFSSFCRFSNIDIDFFFISSLLHSQ